MAGDGAGHNPASAAEAAEAARRLLAAEGGEDAWPPVPLGWPPVGPGGRSRAPEPRGAPPITLETTVHGDGAYQAAAFTTVWHHADAGRAGPSAGYVRRAVAYDSGDDRFVDRYEWHGTGDDPGSFCVSVLRRVDGGDADWPAAAGGAAP